MSESDWCDWHKKIYLKRKGDYYGKFRLWWTICTTRIKN